MSKEFMQTLIEGRAKAWEEAKALLDTAAKEERDLTSEEARTYDRINSDLDAKDKRLKELSDLEARNKDFEEQRSEFSKILQPKPEEEKRNNKPDSDEERLVRWIKASADGSEYAPRSIEIKMTGQDYRNVQSRIEHRTLSKLTAAAGANVVDETFATRLYEHLIENSTVRMAGATIIPTGGGEQMTFPRTTAHGGASLVAEAGTIPASDATFGQVVLDAYKYGKLTQVSHELANDSAVNLLDYLARDSGRALGNASGAHYINGTGTGQPEGIITAASVGVTGPAGTTVSLGAQGTANQGADALLNLIYSVSSPYRRNGKFLTNDASVKGFRTLKDTTGQYIWSPSLQVGAPDSIFGYPVLTDPNVPVMAANARSIAFGDFSAYYIRDVEGMRYERSDDFAFNQDLITFRGLIRTDGALMDTAAIKVFVNSAT